MKLMATKALRKRQDSSETNVRRPIPRCVQLTQDEKCVLQSAKNSAFTQEPVFLEELLLHTGTSEPVLAGALRSSSRSKKYWIVADRCCSRFGLHRDHILWASTKAESQGGGKEKLSRGVEKAYASSEFQDRARTGASTVINRSRSGAEISVDRIQALSSALYRWVCSRPCGREVHLPKYTQCFLVPVVWVVVQAVRRRRILAALARGRGCVQPRARRRGPGGPARALRIGAAWTLRHVRQPSLHAVQQNGCRRLAWHALRWQAKNSWLHPGRRGRLVRPSSPERRGRARRQVRRWRAVPAGGRRRRPALLAVRRRRPRLQDPRLRGAGRRRAGRRDFSRRASMVLF